MNEVIKFFIPNVGTKFSLIEDWTVILERDAFTVKFLKTFCSQSFKEKIEAIGSYGYNEGFPCTFSKGTIFEVCKYTFSEESYALVKVIWTPLKPQQNSVSYSLKIKLADLTPSVRMVENTSSKSLNLFEVSKGKVLQFSEMLRYSNRKVYIECSHQEKDLFQNLSVYKTWGKEKVYEITINIGGANYTLQMPLVPNCDFPLENLTFEIVKRSEEKSKVKSFTATIRKPLEE